jgi:hypothetical protein
MGMVHAFMLDMFERMYAVSRPRKSGYCWVIEREYMAE